jgi:hypothetical protein
MPAFIDITGHRFGRLVALEPTAKRDIRGGVIWKCRCDCGTELLLRSNWLRSSNNTSCGCWRVEKLLEMTVTHGMTGTSTYRVWSGMIQRCLNPDSKHFPMYGARGITVCNRWRDFSAFYEDMGERPEESCRQRTENLRDHFGTHNAASHPGIEHDAEVPHQRSDGGALA